MFDNFFGNLAAADTLERMIESGRIPQTLLLDGPDGVGKATLARRFGARLLGHPERIERDDLSLPHNVETLAERERLVAEKRNDDPFLLATHPDFVTFAPDGPLRQISIHQMRLLRERAQYGPLHGTRRVFLIDGIDRANEQAANSLLKTLEEPPPYLIFLLTAENPYELLPTIRSRSVAVRLSPLSREEMLTFGRARQLDNLERRIALTPGRPGAAATLDLEAYDRRRALMLAFVESAAGVRPFSAWAGWSEKFAAARGEKLEPYLKTLYLLLSDLLRLNSGDGAIHNADLFQPLSQIAARVPFEWIRVAVKKTDELVADLRRNVNKNLALDALVLELRESAR